MRPARGRPAESRTADLRRATHEDIATLSVLLGAKQKTQLSALEQGLGFPPQPELPDKDKSSLLLDKEQSSLLLERNYRNRPYGTGHARSRRLFRLT